MDNLGLMDFSWGGEVTLWNLLVHSLSLSPCMCPSIALVLCALMKRRATWLS